MWPAKNIMQSIRPAELYRFPTPALNKKVKIPKIAYRKMQGTNFYHSFIGKLGNRLGPPIGWGLAPDL